MCLTIPGKIEAIKDGIAIVKSHRERAEIDLSLVYDAKVGDWVLYATNRAVKVISEADAKEILALLEDNYHPVDVAKLPLKFKKIIYKVRSYSSSDESPKSRSSRQARTINKPILTKEEILYLLKLRGEENLETLYAEANFLRKDKIDDFVCIHGIIEFSNYCRNDCLYCGIRASNEIPRYRMTKAEIIETAKKAVKDGYKLLVLQSGEDMSYSDEDLIALIREIRAEMKVFIFLSVGERSLEFYKNVFAAGASGSLMRFESSNADLYRRMRPKHTLTERLNSIKGQMAQGYYMATGSLIGLPDQTLPDIADDLLFLKHLNPPMISAGPFLPAKGTPLFCHSCESRNLDPGFRIKSGMTDGEKLELTLKYIAIARFLMPEVKIPVTTALETLDPKNGRHKALLAGANALMFSLTPEKYCRKYSIYDNKYREREKVWQKYGLFKGEESWEMLEKRLMLKK